MPEEGLPVVGFDWDGTLFHSDAFGVEFEDPAILERKTWPRYGALHRVRQAPCVPVIITGRTEAARRITLKQARRHLGRDIVVITQESWQGMDALVAYKAAAIREAGCHAYVGDTDQDRLAAKLAGVPFLHADAFAEHGLIPLFPDLKVTA